MCFRDPENVPATDGTHHREFCGNNEFVFQAVVTYQRVVQADVSLHLEAPVAELDNRHFSTRDRAHLVERSVFLHFLCKVFNHLDGIYILKANGNFIDFIFPCAHSTHL